MVKRKIVEIDESLCDGCGNCVMPCAEGAIVIVDGKAKVVNDALCDGAGFCIGVCPRGALSIIEREAAAFEEITPLRREGPGTDMAAINCYMCGAGEDTRVLIPIRTEGSSKWVCVHCLPQLIHG